MARRSARGQKMGESFPARNKTVNARSAGLEMGMKAVHISLPRLDGIESIPFRTILVKGSAFVNERKTDSGVVFQPYSKEIDSVLDVRRLLDKIVKTTIDLAKMSVRKIELVSLDAVMESPDLFHPQNIRDRRMHQNFLKELRREFFSEVRDAGGGLILHMRRVIQQENFHFSTKPNR
ncbi:hypothetical protein BDM02DRAFT_3124586 [Thelephora ganbajun]|uniref:Uncharacterized protein n=1 Tax=Thelephora ganbajun TaxID=370292 RepID=A0ACB6YYM6_THEGA|nr:hypothetical protein BDM02DRAFT_3124586 [Thelephora ganbajun]